MTTYHQYRITVGDRSMIHDNQDIWNETHRISTERGWMATLERRIVVENPSWVFLDGLRDLEDGSLPKGSYLLADKYVGDWTVIADTKERVIGGLFGEVSD